MMDEGEFTQAWMRAQPVVASVLVAQLGDPHAVDDVLQETAAAAYAGRDRLEYADRFTSWAVGIARHKAIDHLRAGGRRSKHVMIADPEALAAFEQAASRVGERFGNRGMALHECLRSLTQRARRALQLRYFEERDVDEVAAAISVSQSNAKVILHRARTALRECIDRREAVWERPA
jgi:RNA polymerase sigma-70 factor (ECF subfamily)